MRGRSSESIERRRAFGAGWIGLILITLVVGGCFLLTPWACGVIEDDGLGRRRFEATNLNLALLPPLGFPVTETQANALNTQMEAGAYVPGRILGTDEMGRDFFARCIVGGTISLGIGLSAAFVAVLIGTLYGAYSGWQGGRTDAVLMRLIDILFGLPYILLVVLLAVAVDGLLFRMGSTPAPGVSELVNVLTLLVAIGGVSWLAMARVIRGQVLSLREQPFMEAARACGLPAKRQFFKHLLPNLMGPIIVYATLAVPAAILSESFLSFLGIGVSDPLPSWGNLAAGGLSELNTVKSRWWLLVWPCLLIGSTLLALNFVGDHLKDRFDPVRVRT